MASKQEMTSVSIEPGDRYILKRLREEGINVSGLFRKAIRAKFREICDCPSDDN